MNRKLIFSEAAQISRNAFRGQWGEDAETIMRDMEARSRLAPQAGEPDGRGRFALNDDFAIEGGIVRCRAVYIFNATAVKWLLFKYQFTTQR